MRKVLDYIVTQGRYGNIVYLDEGIDWFPYRDDEKIEDLPAVGAWCKRCAKESAKPMMPVYMNYKPAYALHCEKCGSEYAMYKSMFIQRYVGYDTANGGHINPTHGLISHVAAMDRKAREYHDSIPDRVAEDMCKLFHCTREEYDHMKKGWDEENKKAHKRIEREAAERHARYQDEEIKRESETRRDLIARGVLKYVKNIGLVNTETGQVVKL